MNASKFFLSLTFAGVLAAAGQVEPPQAQACGMFVPTDLADAVPTIMQEKVLILHDAEKGRQHFVRQVNFDAKDTEFGFIVPTPSQPQVAKAKAPFKALRKSFPFQRLRPPGSGGEGANSRGKGMAVGGAPPVQVLEVKRVGKFTAFVLDASDAAALDNWLKNNNFKVPTQARPWLSHYVKLGFYYVAFRYDRPKKKGQGLASETVRISFDSPAPYYPYLEPLSARPYPTRLLSLWLVTSRGDYHPVARRTGRALFASSPFYRPWRPGLVHSTSSAALKPVIGPLTKFLPKGAKLSVQTFRDRKRERKGWGDVVLVPGSAIELSEAQLAKHKQLISVLDPSLAGAK